MDRSWVSSAASGKYPYLTCSFRHSWPRSLKRCRKLKGVQKDSADKGAQLREALQANVSRFPGSHFTTSGLHVCRPLGWS